MNTIDIIRQIVETIENPDISRSNKSSLLKDLARKYWELVFPEIKGSTFDQLSQEAQEARWKAVRMRNELAGIENRQKVQYVLDWPATGGNFQWLT